MSGSSSYLAIDLGASNGRAILGTLEGDRLRLEELHRFPTPVQEQDGHLYWALPAIWEEVQAGLKAASLELRSVSVNSWGVDYVPLDGDHRPLRNAYCYRDPRHAGFMQRAIERVGAEEIYRITGIQFMEINTLYQVMADLDQEPALFARTALRLPIADYFNYRLSGRPVSEVSLASTTQMLDVQTRRWAFDMLRDVDLPAAGWPEIVPSGTRLGSARPEGSRGAEVVASCSHDTACAVAATPVAGEDGWAYLSCGSWSLLGVERREPILSARARSAGFTNEAGLDGTIRFLKNLTGLWVLQECEREWREGGKRYSYEELLAEASAADAPTGYVDLNDPRFLGRGEMLRKLCDYCREHGIPVPSRRGNVVRLILESLAESYREAIRELEDVTEERIDMVHLMGGGSRNEMLCQLTADACGCRVLAGPAEATAIGNIMIQARTMGDLPQTLSIRQVVRESTAPRVYDPRPAAASTS